MTIFARGRTTPKSLAHRFWLSGGPSPTESGSAGTASGTAAPEKVQRGTSHAYRHIVDLMRANGADNLQWVWHVNWLDEPEKEWNRFENYFPGGDHCDWVAVSAYGPTTPTTPDGRESLAFKMREAYPRLVKIAPGKPIILAEFGCDLRSRHVNAADWAKAALEDLFSNRWPGVIGFCWWNEGWQNDDHKKHDTDMIILHDRELTRVFHEEFANHADKIQEKPVISQ